jgi:hypothetical protein
MTPHKRQAEAIHEDPSLKRSKFDDDKDKAVEKKDGECSDLHKCGSSVPKITSKSEDALGGDARKLTHIEADAAEDKGCRHTMEDAWVLLPDASCERSGKLRYNFYDLYDFVNF